MNDILKRFLTAIVAGGIAVTAIVLSAWGSWLFGLVVSMLGLHEFYRMTGVKSRTAKGFMFGLGLLIWLYMVGFYLFPIAATTWTSVLVLETNLLPVFLALMAIPAILVLFDKAVKAPALEMASLTFGFLYAYFPMLLFFMLSLDPAKMPETFSFKSLEFLRSDAYDFRIPLGLLLLSWGLDTFAYFGGRFIGGKKLFPRISPKKTWAGTISGALACIGVGFGLEWLWPVSWSWVAVACMMAVLAQLGDLVESMYKRGLNIKDAGGILPGHGGMLDRFDGMYLSLPVIYVYYLIVMSTQFT